MDEQAASLRGKFIVGVTGNIATGKSVVTRLAAENGALTIDADKLVHEVMDSDVEMQAAIAVAFGPEVRRSDGRIERRVLGDIVFNDPDAMRDLEEMIHPPVYEETVRRLAESDRRLVFIEAIKLLEGNLAEICQQIWVTRCSKQRQLERLRICRGMNTPTAATRIKAQPPQEDKVAMADVVIDTNGYMTETTTQFERAWDRLPDWARKMPEAKPSAPARLKRPPRPRPEPEAKLAEQPQRQAETAPTTVGGDKRESVTAVPDVVLPKRPDDLEIRRARPSDIPSILLHIQNATDGTVKMKRADLLMALSERSYFIGQVGTEVNTVMGWSIDSQVASIDQVFIHPLLEEGIGTASAMVEEIEKSANAHICEIIVAFVREDAAKELRHLFASHGFEGSEKEQLPVVWQSAIDESQPEDTFFMLKILREERLKRALRP
jgi:dephospho-CoA kinase